MLKGYTAPRTPLGRSSLVQPPPWHYVGTALAVEYDARPEAVAAFLPAPLRPGREALAGRCAAYFCDWQFASGEAAAGGEPEYLDPVHSQYREFILLLTAEFEGSPCAYCPFIWVDQDASLLRGLIQGCRSPSVPRRRPRPALAAGEPVDLTPLEEVDRRHMPRVFEVVGRNQRRAAQLLGVDRKTPPGKLARYGARESSRRGGQGRRR